VILPIGWDSRSFPVKKYEIDEYGDVIWYIFDGVKYTPHKREIILEWDQVYLSKKRKPCYNLKELRNAHDRNYMWIAKGLSMIGEDFLE